ncbi:MAG: flavin reductase family protein [Methylovulum sp.]|uniref:flavin reductase family protein n=1 Tax=Methylovulum sp. TaxID=1916980 RepID=UPI00261AF072|nr:flavin reductase family protein [Methylovulum sp.]MDD2724131.1 flavin reductase family protein [Methylovulum sp.]MDD5124628.1 flavin reductase family protein [Methylovulum sp.]
MMTQLPELFKNINTGVYIIGVSDGGHHHAFTAAWVMQVSFNPPLLAISINPHNYSYQLLQAGGICTVNVLGQEQLAIAGHFGRNDIADKMAGFVWQQDCTGAPILATGLAYFDCRISHYADAGDHKIAICEVLAANKLRDGKPMLYVQTGEMDGSSQLYAKD